MGKTSCTRCKGDKSKKKKACKTKEGSSVLYICEKCQVPSFKPGAICAPKEAAPAFVCKKCGAPSVEKKGVCKPQKA